MTSKEKAKELVEMFLNSDLDSQVSIVHIDAAINCAIISVDEILNAIGTPCSECQDEQQSVLVYWTSVKTELESMKGGGNG